MNSVPDTINALWPELGRTTPQIEAVIVEEDPEDGTVSWIVEFEDESSVLVDWCAEPKSLVLTADLGSVAEQNALPVYESLLTFNAMHLYTGGVSASIGGPGGSAMLTQTIAMVDVLTDVVRDALIGFSALAQVWSAYVNNPSNGTSPMPLPLNNGYLTA